MRVDEVDGVLELCGVILLLNGREYAKLNLGLFDMKFVLGFELRGRGYVGLNRGGLFCMGKLLLNIRGGG